jgi:protein involved in polysaccharide export with SLBB domain
LICTMALPTLGGLPFPKLMNYLPTLRSRLWRLLALGLVVNLCLSSCVLFRRDRDKDGEDQLRAQSLGDYRLASGSIVTLEKFEGGKSTMQADLVVDGDGNLRMPEVGDVSVVGMTPQDAAKKIEFLARKSGQNYLGGPRVHFKALDRRAVVHVSGHVERSGPVTFTPGLTVADAIDAAGGTTEHANSGSIGLTTEGRKKIVTTPKAQELKEGDVVNVPRRL